MRDSSAQKIIHHVISAYDAIADHFSQTRNDPWPEFDLILPHLRENMSLSDLGCGNGRFLLWLQKKIQVFHYTGIDGSAQLISECEKRFSQSSSIRFLIHQLPPLPFPDNSFDVIVSLAFLYHIPSHRLRKLCVEESARVLRPGGVLFLMNWNLWQYRFWKNHIQSLSKIIKGELDFGDIWIPWKNSGGNVQKYRFGHAFTNHEMKSLLQQSSFHIEQCQWMKNAKPSSWINGSNLLAIAKKPS